MLFFVEFDDSVGHVSGLGYRVFVPIGVESKCDVFLFVFFVLIGVNSKGGQLIETFFHPNSLFSLQI